MQFPHTNTSTKRLTRKKIRNTPAFPHLPYTLFLAVLFFLLGVLVVLTTSPKNPFFLMLFLVAIGGGFACVLRMMKISLVIACIVTATIEGLLVLRIFQMGSLLNIVLVVAIGVCFVSFARNIN